MAFSERLKKFELGLVEVPQIVEEVPFTDYITEALSKKVSSIPVWHDYDYDKQFELVLSFLDSKLNSEFEDFSLSDSEKRVIAEDFLKTNNGFGLLDKLIAREDVNSIFVNSFGTVYVSIEGEFKKTEVVLAKPQFANISAMFDKKSCVVREKVNNLYVTLLRPPVADNVLIIKKINTVTEDLTDIVEKGVITEELAKFLQTILLNRKNIILSSSEHSIKDEFLQVLMNSIKPEKRIAFVEDLGSFANLMENVTDFSVASLEDFDFEYLLSTVCEMNFDYEFSAIKDYKKFVDYYAHNDCAFSGLVTSVKAPTSADAVSKFNNAAMLVFKSTEKQAKIKFSSTYDYLIQLEKDEANGYRIESVMEITSTKNSSLVMNEVVKFLGDGYLLDLPENFYDLQEVKAVELPKVPVRKSFSSRIKGV